jgi:hypothetical protein
MLMLALSTGAAFAAQAITTARPRARSSRARRGERHPRPRGATTPSTAWGGNDLLYGRCGATTASTAGPATTRCAAAGDDRAEERKVFGGSGDDTLYGDAGDDALYGGPG